MLAKICFAVFDLRGKTFIHLARIVRMPLPYIPVNSDQKNKPATIHDVALKSGCSTSTVSNVLNGTGRVGIVQRDIVLQVAKELKYSAAPSGRSLRIGRMETIGMLFYPSCSWLFRNPFYTQVIEGLEHELTKRRYNLLLAGFKSYSDISIQRLKRSMDGVVLVGSFPAKVTEELYSIQENLVMLDYTEEDVPAGSIVSDGIASSRMVVEHLVALGHRHIVMAAYFQTDYNTEMRIRGFTEAMSEGSIAPQLPALEGTVIRLRQHTNTDAIVKSVVQCLKGKNPPTAVYAVNDTLAMAINNACAVNGLRVPEDVSIVGFNDDDFAPLMQPPLTTIHVNRTRLGLRCAELIVKRIADPSAPAMKLCLSTKLIVRKSTAPPATACTI